MDPLSVIGVKGTLLRPLYSFDPCTPVGTVNVVQKGEPSLYTQVRPTGVVKIRYVIRRTHPKYFSLVTVRRKKELLQM